MKTKLVLRLLTAENALLGWTEHQAIALGDGCLRATSYVGIPVDAAGVPVCVSIHWADVHVETSVPCPPTTLHVGEWVPVFEAGVPMVTLGAPPVGLPAVTLKQSVSIGIPVGQLGTAAGSMSVRG